jgi:hypothetical protein
MKKLHISNGIYIENENYSFIPLAEELTVEEIKALFDSINTDVIISGSNVFPAKAKTGVFPFTNKQELINGIKSLVSHYDVNSKIESVKRGQSLPFGRVKESCKILTPLPGCCGASYLASHWLFNQEISQDWLIENFGIMVRYLNDSVRHRNVTDDELLAFRIYLIDLLYMSAASYAIESLGTRLLIATDSDKEPKYTELSKAIVGQSEVTVKNNKTGNMLNTYSFDANDMYEYYSKKVRDFIVNQSATNNLFKLICR